LIFARRALISGLTQDDSQDLTAMTDNTAPAPETATEERNGAPAEAPATVPDHAQATLTRELGETRDRLLRALAEMENLRRRTEREVADARAYGIANFARDLLGASDNMRRALEAVGAELRSTADPTIRALIDGVELTERELGKALEKHGVRKLEAQGAKFDPNVHQAMYEVPDPSVPAGTVVQVVQPGYMIGERVLRPAMVAVAKGGPKAPPAPSPANDNPGSASQA
jgi:molecular chaperone GrpE